MTQFFVRKDGNDANDGLSNDAGGAFLTITRAVQAAYQTPGTSEIKVGPGIYAETVSFVGGSAGPDEARFNFRLYGDFEDPSKVVISGQSNSSFLLQALGGVRVDMGGFSLLPQNKTAYCLQTLDPGTFVNFKKLVFGKTIADHITSQSASVVTFDGDYGITGGARNHYHATEFGCIKAVAPAVVSITGNPLFSGQFIGCAFSSIYLGNTIFSGTARGLKYLTHYAGAIRTASGNKSAIPGNIPGLENAGGVFDYPSRFSAHKSGVDQILSTPGILSPVSFGSVSGMGGCYDSGNSSWMPPGGCCKISACVTFIAATISRKIARACCI